MWVAMRHQESLLEEAGNQNDWMTGKQGSAVEWLGRVQIPALPLTSWVSLDNNFNSVNKEITDYKWSQLC